jgi:hypothetical protein
VDGNVRVRVPFDDILQKRDYYFQVSSDHQGVKGILYFNTNTKRCLIDLYPIVPSFEDWVFPHGRRSPA